MNAAAVDVLTALRRDGTQTGVLERMQTRAALYEALDYPTWESRMDRYAELEER